VSPSIPAVLSDAKTGAQKILGIAAGFGPSGLLMDSSDEIIKVVMKKAVAVWRQRMTIKRNHREIIEEGW